MKSWFYRWHRRFALTACAAVLLWCVSGLCHPIMVWTQPAPALAFLPPKALDPDALLTPISQALAKNGIETVQQARVVALSGRAYYQVQVNAGEPPIYLDGADGSERPDGDRDYAVELARVFLGDADSKVVGVRRLERFDSEIPERRSLSRDAPLSSRCRR